MGLLHLVYHSLTLAKKSREPAESAGEDFLLFTVISILLVLLAGLMSGLTLGLLSIDALDLEVCPLIYDDKVQLGIEMYVS